MSEIPKPGSLWTKPSFPVPTTCEVVAATAETVSIKLYPRGRRVHDWPMATFLERWEKEPSS